MPVLGNQRCTVNWQWSPPESHLTAFPQSYMIDSYQIYTRVTQLLCHLLIQHRCWYCWLCQKCATCICMRFSPVFATKPHREHNKWSQMAPSKRLQISSHLMVVSTFLCDTFNKYPFLIEVPRETAGITKHKIPANLHPVWTTQMPIHRHWTALHIRSFHLIPHITTLHHHTTHHPLDL